MKKSVRTVFALIVVLLLALVVSGCSADTGGSTDTKTVTVVSITVDTDTVPAVLTAGAPDLSGIKLTVIYSDGTSETVSVTSDMVYVGDESKLLTEGTKTISLHYGGKTAKLTITLQNPPAIVYTARLMTKLPESTGDGYLFDTKTITYDSKNSINNRITIVAEDKSSGGYVFTAWKKGGETISTQPTTEVTVDGNIVLVAHYTEMKFRVYFNVNGGIDIAQMDTREIAYDKMPLPTREGYVFTGWTDSEALSQVSFSYRGSDISLPVSTGYLPEGIISPSDYYYQVTKNTTLVAQWEPLGLVFKITAGGYAVEGYTYVGNRTYLVIPESYQGVPVVHITATAFGNLNGGVYSYESAAKLKTIKLPQHINIIDDYAFSNCVSLVNISLDNRNASFSERSGVIFGNQQSLIAYPPGKMATSYVVTENVSSIRPGAFMNANVGSISVRGGSLTYIGSDAFNSRTIDNVIFGDALPGGIPSDAKNIFNSNIAHIYVRNDSDRAAYSAHQAMKAFASKFEVNQGETTAIFIYDGLLLYRRLAGIDRSIEIIGADRSITSLTVPSNPINEYTFTSIARYAFSYCYSLTSFSLSNETKIERILNGAFDNTPWLKNSSSVKNGMIIINNVLYLSLEDKAEYRIPYEVVKIAESCFEGRTSLSRIIFEKNSNGLTAISTIASRAFYGCAKLSEFVLPQSVVTLGASAFAGTDLSLFSVEANSRLATIREDCFLNAAGLKRMDLYSTAASISYGAFRGCTSLTAFVMNTAGNKNAYFKTVDGVLYAYNHNLPVGQQDNVGEILHTYPAAKMVAIFDVDDSVKIIAEYAFYNANIGGIVLPAGLTALSPSAIFVPQLTFVEFKAVVPSSISRWQDLFAMFEDVRYIPSYIFIAQSDNSSYTEFSYNMPALLNLAKRYGAGVNGSNVNNVIISPSDFRLITTSSLIYRYDRIPGAGYTLNVIGADRTVAKITFPETVISEMETLNITGISPYAFRSVYLKEVEMPASVNKISAYAFYYSLNINKITLKGAVPPELEYSQPGNVQSVTSFNPSVILSNALVYVPLGRIDTYAAAWPTDRSFILAEGTSPQVIFLPENGDSEIIYGAATADLLGLDYIADEISKLPVVTKKGYTFVGWFDNGEKVSFPYLIHKNVTLKAQWRVNTYSVIYETAGGNFESSNINADVEYGSVEILSVPVKSGYVFVGWFALDGTQYTDKDGKLISMASWDIDGDLNVVAKWGNRQYNITLDAKGGSVSPDTALATYNNPYLLPVPVYAGYNFEGWADENGNTVTFTGGESVNNWLYLEDKIFHAKWKAKVYTIGLVPQPGAMPRAVQVTFGSNFTLYVPEAVGKSFLGWYDGVDGSGTQYTDEYGKSVRKWDKAETGVLLYAQWPTEITDYNALNTLLRANPEKGYVLMNDITVPDGTYWTPIPEFTGVLDGNGYFIYNMKINAALTQQYNASGASFAGFIAINKGVVRNIKFGIYAPGATVKSEITVADTGLTMYVGGVAGINLGTIKDCNVTVYINTAFITDDTVSYVGGLCGYNAGILTGNILKVEISVSSVDDGIYTGSLTGYNAAAGSISQCVFERFVADESETALPCGNQNSADFGAYIGVTGGVIQGSL